MTILANKDVRVGRKKSTEPKPDTTMIRVSVEFADAIREAAYTDKISIAKLADDDLLPVVRKRYQESIIKKASQFKSGK